MRFRVEGRHNGVGDVIDIDIMEGKIGRAADLGDAPRIRVANDAAEMAIGATVGTVDPADPQAHAAQAELSRKALNQLLAGDLRRAIDRRRM